MLMPGFGPLGLPEIIILLVIVMVLFGAKKLPALGSGLGKGIKNFMRSLKGTDEDGDGDQGDDTSDRSNGAGD